jgi:hypothetical protein
MIQTVLLCSISEIQSSVVSDFLTIGTRLIGVSQSTRKGLHSSGMLRGVGLCFVADLSRQHIDSPFQVSSVLEHLECSIREDGTETQRAFFSMGTGEAFAGG